jgi:arsenate reductase
MDKVTLYHNPRCSKSRQTRALLEEKDLSLTIVEYLKTPLSLVELTSLLKKLKLKPSELIRKTEVLFKTLGLKDKDDDTLLEAMCSHPILIERPIVVSGNKAVLGRPPENIHDLV